MLPYLTSGRPPSFAFIVHPRGMADLYRFSSASFLLKNSRNEEEFQRKMCSVSPLIIGDLIFGFSPVRGDLICVTRMPDKMTGDSANRAVVDAVELAADRGARVVGLGALTSPATGGGATVVRNVPKGITVTNGNAYTAAVVAHNVEEASNMAGLGAGACVAVVGCTGSVGAAASRLLAQKGFRLILVGRNVNRTRALFLDLEGACQFSDRLDSIVHSDIVLLLTSHPSSLLSEDLGLKGSIVVDCAQPANVTPGVARALARNGVLVFEGGLVQIRNYLSTYDFGLPDSRTTFACLAETYLFIKEGIRDHSVGRPKVDLAHRMERAAARNGVCPRRLALLTEESCYHERSNDAC